MHELDEHVTLTEAAKIAPGRPSTNCMWRWCRRGVLSRTGERVHLRIADNRTADLATWDLELLPIELAELKELDVDIALLGFSEDELARLLHPDLKEGLTDPDAVPEPSDEPVKGPPISSSDLRTVRA